MKIRTNYFDPESLAVNGRRELCFSVAGSTCFWMLELILGSDDVQPSNVTIANGGKGEVEWEFSNYGKAHLRIGEAIPSDQGSQYELNLSFEPIRDFDAVLHFKLGFLPHSKPYFQIPGSLYGDSSLADSRSIQPQLSYRRAAEYPLTDTLFTRSDRSTHLCVSFQDEGLCAGLQVQEFSDDSTARDGYVENGLSVTASEKNQWDAIGITMGYCQYPRLYKGKLRDQSLSSGPVYQPVHFAEGVTKTLNGCLYLADNDSQGTADANWGFERINRCFYERIHQSPEVTIDRKRAVHAMGSAIVEDAYLKDYHYFPTVLSGNREDTGISGDVAWTGGVQVVYPLLRSWREVPGALDVVRDFVSNLVETGVSPKTGLFFESKYKDQWSTRGWWTELIEKYHPDIVTGKGVHSAYINGQACCYLLKMLRTVSESHLDEVFGIGLTELCMERVYSILSHVVSCQRVDGALPIYFDPEEGRPLLFEGCQALWFLAAIAEAYKDTQNEKWLRAFDAANAFYFKYLKNGCLWGMPMDTGDAPDQECGLPYATALACMHQVLHREEDLDALLHVLHYDFSWKFAYNTRHRNEPLKSLNWSSSGGCVTSSHNIHIHQMGNLIAEEIYYAWLQTKDPYLESRLRDTLKWGLGTFNHHDGHFGFGRTGWSTEQFFHSDGVQDDPNRIPNGGIWPDFLCWASACVLLSCTADIPDHFYE